MTGRGRRGADLPPCGIPAAALPRPTRFSPAGSSLLLAALLAFLTAPPAHAQLGRVLDRARRGAERTVNRTVDRTAESATQTAANAATPGRAEAVEAARQLVEAYRAHRDAFNDPRVAAFDQSVVGGRWAEDGPAWLAAVEAVEANYDAIQAPMRALAERFGPQWHEVDTGLRQMGIADTEYGDGETTAPHAYQMLELAMGKVAQFRRDVAESAAIGARVRVEMLREAGDLTPQQVEAAEGVRAELELAHRFDPNNVDVNALLAQTANLVAELEAEMRAQIEAARWPGHAAGAPSNLAPAALAFFRAHSEWGGRPDVEVLAVAVRGGWEPAERNLLGQVTQWRLPVVVASVKPEWRELGAARMFELSVLAQPGNPAPQAPPFYGYWVGSSGFISLERVPAE